MTTSSQDSRDPVDAADAAVTAILPDWSDPSDAAVTNPTTGTGTAAATGPTVRWGALVWALLFGATAATTLWVLVDPMRRDAVGDWVLTLNPLTATLSAVVVVGVVVALFGIVGLIRRGERSRR